MIRYLLLAALLAALGGCAKSGPAGGHELWIYTSIYREVLDQLEPAIKAKFPDWQINWFKAGSEEVAAKLNAELAAGGTQADVIMTSDPFFYENLKAQQLLAQYESPGARAVPKAFKDADGYYTGVRVSTMIITYNEKLVPKATAPQGFAELVKPAWKNKVAIPDALKSGTAFTTVAFLSDKLGWSYFKALRANGGVANGGNSAVLKSVESGEYPVGVILLENVLKARKEHQSPLGIVYPKEGAVLIPGPIAIFKSSKHLAEAKQLYDFMLSAEGAKAIVAGYMHAPDLSVPPPEDALPLDKLMKASFPWTGKFLTKVRQQGDAIKEQYSKAMLG